MNAAWGPPKPIGTPKRCAEPTAMSAPSCARRRRQHAGQQVGGDDGEAAAGVDRARSRARQSATAPVDVGRLNSAPKQPAVELVDVADDELDADRLGPRRQHGDRLRVGVVVDDEAVAMSTLDSRRAMAIASAAAVASSSSEALATGSPVSSLTIVWKLSSASSRPWLISGWYGV